MASEFLNKHYDAMEKLTLANRLSIRIMAVLIVMSTAINNINDIESDLDDPDKLQIHLERMVNQHVYVELQTDLRAARVSR